MSENVKEEHKNKLIKIIVIIINIIALICLIYLAIPYIKHDTTINNPTAMITAESWDMSGFLLTIGLLPLIGANLCAFKFIDLKSKIIKLLFFIPSIICLLIVVQYIYVSFGTNEGKNEGKYLFTLKCHLHKKEYNYDIYAERNGYSIDIDEKDKIPLGDIDYSSDEAIEESISYYFSKNGGSCDIRSDRIEKDGM